MTKQIFFLVHDFYNALQALQGEEFYDDKVEPTIVQVIKLGAMAKTTFATEETNLVIHAWTNKLIAMALTFPFIYGHWIVYLSK